VIESLQVEVQSADSAHIEWHDEVHDLVKLWCFSRETIRQMVKDDPGVIKIRFALKKCRTTYCIPESAAKRIHSKFGGLESSFREQHFKIGDLARRWKLGRETIRLMIKNEPGVMKVRLGRKRSHAAYSVPDAVAKRIHYRLLCPV
jgi:type IV secretory pathway TrbD component